MQLLSKLNTLAVFMATASALAITLDERATTPTARVVSFNVVECTQSGVGGVVQPQRTLVAENNCTALPPTASFETFQEIACPAKTSPELTAYSLAGCSGTGVVSRSFSDISPACIEAQLGGAKSAFFKCNAS